MILAINGLTGSGKNTLGELLAKELSYKLVCPTFKDLAKEEGISLMEFQKKAENDHNIDKKFDDVLKKQAKGNCVVTTWLGPWIVKPDVSIRLFAPLEIRAQRVAKRDGMTPEEARKHVEKRDNGNRKRYLEVYGIDIFNTDIFNACISSEKYNPEQLKKIVLDVVRIKFKK